VAESKQLWSWKMPLRYVIAVMLACAIAGAGFGMGRHLQKSFTEEIRQRLRTAKAEGRLPKELESVDIDTFTLENCDVRLTERDERRIWAADWLLYGWHIWVPITFIISIGVAFLTRGRTG
jgi:hypothetical protein